MGDSTTPALYEPLLETVATWAVEYKAAQVVMFTQQSGNEIRVIASRQWDLASVSEVINEARQFPWFKSITNHVIPPDADGVYTDLFTDAGIVTEAAPALRPAEVVTITRELFPVLRIDPEANKELVEALKEYKLASLADETLGERHDSWKPYYMVRAVELFACWRKRVGSRKARDTNAARIYREKRRLAAYG